MRRLEDRHWRAIFGSCVVVGLLWAVLAPGGGPVGKRARAPARLHIVFTGKVARRQGKLLLHLPQLPLRLEREVADVTDAAGNLRLELDLQTARQADFCTARRGDFLSRSPIVHGACDLGQLP